MAKIPKRKAILLPVKYDKLPKGMVRIIREEYARIQQGQCYYCKEQLDLPPAKYVRAMPLMAGGFPKHFFRYKVHLHHCHNTGLTIGAVHAYCNAVLWEYEGE